MVSEVGVCGSGFDDPHPHRVKSPRITRLILSIFI